MAQNSNSNDYLTVRVSVELRTEFVRFCKAQDLTPSQVINMFVQYYIRTKDATCCFAVDDTHMNGVDKSENLAVWLDTADKDKFAALAMPNMSTLVRGYMRYCLVKGIPDFVLGSMQTNKQNREILQQQVNKLQDIRIQLTDGSIDSVKANRLSDNLSDVCDELDAVIDKI